MAAEFKRIKENLAEGTAAGGNLDGLAKIADSEVGEAGGGATERPPGDDAERRTGRDRRAGFGQAASVFAGRFERFIGDLATLTKTQRRVFELYVRNYTADEIAAELHITMSTLKTHNRNILLKLGVTSRKEMMVYVNIMKIINQNFPEDESENWKG